MSSFPSLRLLDKFFNTTSHICYLPTVKAFLFWTTWSQNLSRRTEAISPQLSIEPWLLACFLLSPMNVRLEVQKAMRIYPGKKLFTAVHMQHFQLQEMSRAPDISKNPNLSFGGFLVVFFSSDTTPCHTHTPKKFFNQV